MRRNWILIATLSVALPAAAGAQEAMPPEEGGPSELDHLPIASDDTPRDFGGAPEGEVVDGDYAAPAAEGGVHTVRSGDTLWDISGRYLQSPWYWPRVWSFNPQIENPHWIYPGDQIRLGPDGAGQVAGEELPPLSMGSFDPVASDDIQVAGRIGTYLPRKLHAPRIGFVSEEELDQSGVLDRSWEEKTYLMEGDRIYIGWTSNQPVEVGADYLIFRTERKVSHPEGGSVGHLTRILGTARVVDANPDEAYVSAIITRSIQEIVRGDRVGPMAHALSERIDRVANEANVDAVIVGTLEENLSELGQGHVVFLDRGRTDGVTPGNTFQVLRAGDGLQDDGYTPMYDETMPAENIGSLVVIDVREKTAAAVVVRSVRELRAGDRALMRATN